MINKSNPYKDHKGKFTQPHKAMPTKDKLDFLKDMHAKHGNVSIGSIIAHYEDKKKLSDMNDAAKEASVQSPLSDVFKAETDDNHLYIMQSFKDTLPIERLQNYLKEQFNYPWVEWEDLADMHVTLLCVYEPEQKALDTFLSILKEFQPVPITVQGVSTFDNEDNNVLYLNVKRTVDLVGLQDKLYQTAQALMMEVSDYSLPDSYQPHITLAYSEEPFDERILASLPVGGIVLPPDKIVSSVNNDTNEEATTNEIYPNPNATVDASPHTTELSMNKPTPPLEYL